jgi:hypothetical protein
LAGVNRAAYTASNFAYNSTTHVATWTLAQPLGKDKLMLGLSASTLTDDAGNAMDGQWTTGQSFPSGNGTAGGNFQFRINVLPGDYDGNGRVLATTDANQVLLRLGARIGQSNYSVFADFDGNGRILATSDANFVLLHLGDRLPTSEPVLPSAWAAAAAVQASALGSAGPIAIAGSTGVWDTALTQLSSDLDQRDALGFLV